MQAVLSQPRMALATVASVVGIAAFWLTMAPIRLLAPAAALFRYAGGRAVSLASAL